MANEMTPEEIAEIEAAERAEAAGQRGGAAEPTQRDPKPSNGGRGAQPPQALAARPPTNAIATRDAMATESLERRGETASVAVAAQAEALVKARYAIAVARPRDWDDVRTRMLKTCRRPRFAQAAIYRKPIGKGVEGPSIRFAEELARAMGNIDTPATVIYDDEDKRIVRVSSMDLETNTTWSKDVVIEKTVERHRPAKGQEVLGTRTNSRGDTVYLVRATEDDLLTKQAALESKAQRSNVLRLVPADILEEALDVCREVRQAEDARDPDAARKKIVDGFASIGVTAKELKAYMDAPLEGLQPAQLDELRAIFTAIRSGEATWREFVATKQGEEPPRGVASVLDRLKGDAA